MDPPQVDLGAPHFSLVLTVFWQVARPNPGTKPSLYFGVHLLLPLYSF